MWAAGELALTMPESPPPYNRLSPPPPYPGAPRKPAVVNIESVESLLTPRVLLLDRYSEEYGRRFVLGDEEGTVLAHIRRDPRRSRPEPDTFDYVLSNIRGTELMFINRPRLFFQSSMRTNVSVRTQHGYKPVGSCTSTRRAANCGYSLDVWTSSTSVPVRKLGQLVPPLTSAREVKVVDPSGIEVASVRWVAQDDGLPHTRGSYIIDMYPEGIGARDPLTLNERCVLLATAISLDFDYFFYRRA